MTTITDADRVLDSLDFEPRCEWRTVPATPKCEHNAKWLMLVSCGDSAYFCPEHKARMASQVHRLEDGGLYCERHPEVGRVLFDWREL